MKVLYIAAECKPFSKTGGVGDVAGELPGAIRECGVDIEIVTPLYGRAKVDERELESVASYEVIFQGQRERVEVLRTRHDGVAVNFVRNATYFAVDYSTGVHAVPFLNPHLFKKDYATPYVDSAPEPIAFYDDALRFSFFSAACLPFIEKLRPDIVHANDWVLGYLFGWMAMKGLPPKRVLTIHNIGYQGNIGRDTITGWDIETIANDRALGPLFADPRVDWESVNALRLAMELAHQVNAVSPTYAREITESEDGSRYFEGGKGLDEVARRLAGPPQRLHGILNGFAYAQAPDRACFEAILAEKSRMKRALARDYGAADAMLIGFVGRAVEQKFRLLTETLDGRSVLAHILDIPDVNVAVLATGQREYETFLRSDELAARPNFHATIAYDRTKAGQISLGSDVFLMPSLFEPCGITQMESMNCATPPLVRWTGGLVDTVQPPTHPSGGTGFGFDGRTRDEVLHNLVAAVRDAHALYHGNRAAFREMQWRGFQQRFLWADAAADYVAKLYEPALGSR